MEEPVEKGTLIRYMQNVLSKYPVLRLAYVYGSFLTHENFCDIDIALLTDTTCDPDSFPRYAS